MLASTPRVNISFRASSRGLESSGRGSACSMVEELLASGASGSPPDVPSPLQATDRDTAQPTQCLPGVDHSQDRSNVAKPAIENAPGTRLQQEQKRIACMETRLRAARLSLRKHSHPAQRRRPGVDGAVVAYEGAQLRSSLPHRVPCRHHLRCGPRAAADGNCRLTMAVQVALPP